MKIRQHVISSLPLGTGYYYFSNDLLSSLLAIISTLLIDSDHLFDYIVTQKKVDPPAKIIEAFKTINIVRKNYFIFHSWELVILSALLLFYLPNKYFFAFFVGFSFHILLDQIFNTIFLGKYNLRLWFYFFFYRRALGFDVLLLRRGDLKYGNGEEIY